MSQRPLLWSFRRCPYAMRARLALKASGQQVILREILLRDKPAPFLAASEKGTVPVLVLPDGQVLDESRDVMFWALSVNDPKGWLHVYHQDKPFVMAHLEAVDTSFKHHLDRYKYATRYEEADALEHREQGAVFLKKWNDILGKQTALSGEWQGIVDYATLPFVRQFRIANSDWFDAQDWPHLHQWLQQFLTSQEFTDVMAKYRPWKDTGDECLF